MSGGLPRGAAVSVGVVFALLAVWALFPKASSEGLGGGPVVLDGRQFGPASLGAPPKAAFTAVLDEFQTRFGDSVGADLARELEASKGLSETARHEVEASVAAQRRANDALVRQAFKATQALAVIRDYQYLEAPDEDFWPNQMIQLRLAAVDARQGGADEVRFALEGADKLCERGLKLKAHRAKAAADVCLATLRAM